MIRCQPRPCPFCACDPDLLPGWTVLCMNPQCRVRPATFHEVTWLDAVAVWNGISGMVDRGGPAVILSDPC